MRCDLGRSLTSFLPLCVLLLATGALRAESNFVATWQGLYPASSSDTNVSQGTGATCQLCHFNVNGGGNWNAYGWRIRQNLNAGQSLSNSILNAALANSDLDPTGCGNGVEIAASAQPGWTPGPNNTKYQSSGTTSGQMPPAGILGLLDPSSPLSGYCSPGAGGTIACPCANAPAAAGKGCNNSDNTGGATIAATGSASVGSDSLVFSTTGQKASATTVLLQGTAQNTTGLVFGQGVRCVAGALKRLYVKAASGGSITAPAGADPAVSARSAALGDVLVAGSQREYMAYYRDPIVLGGCPGSNTWNGTNAGQLYWNP